MSEPTPAPGQWAYGKWWTTPAEGDPQEMDPQPARPAWADAEEK